MFVAVPAFAASPAAVDCTTTAAISAFHYTVNGNAVTDLNQNNVHAGDTVTVHFSIAPGCTGVKVTLASYLVPPGGFDNKTLQVLFSHQTDSFSAGDSEHTLQATLPCSWQADFVIGDVIEHLGKPDYYGNRLKDSGTGTENCASPSPSPTGSIEASATPSPTGSIEASSTPSPTGTPTGGINSSATPSGSVKAASVTNPNTGTGTQAFAGFVAVMMVLTGIAILAEVRRRHLRS